MVIPSIIYFFVSTTLLGFLIDLFVKKWDAGLVEKMVMRFGTGLAAFSVLGVILNLLHIPLHWSIFLGVGFIITGTAIYTNPNIARAKNLKPKSNFWKKKGFWYTIIVLILFVLTANMYMTGTFSYPYFEDGDPWGYAAVSKYIAEDMTFSAPFKFANYAEPYTQGYQIVMGVMHQTNPSIYWTMKFFTTLVLGFSILFFFYFVKRFTKNDEAALFSTIFLFGIPAWLSHFIFSLNWNMVIFLILLYSLAKLQDDKSKSWRGWMFPTLIIWGSLWVNHFYTALAGTILLGVYYIFRVLVTGKLQERILLAGIGGFVLSLAFYIPSYIRHWNLVVPGTSSGFGGVEAFFGLMNMKGVLGVLVLVVVALLLWWKRAVWFKTIGKLLKKRSVQVWTYLVSLVIVLAVLIIPDTIAKSLGSASRDYTLQDFFLWQSPNMINNPVGLGPVVATLCLIAFVLAILNFKKIFSEKNIWFGTTISWTITALLIVLGTYFSIAFIPFRMWTFLAIFAAMLASFPIVQFTKKIKNPLIFMGIALVVLVLMVPAGFSHKYDQNTQQWSETAVGVPGFQSQQTAQISSDIYSFYGDFREGVIPAESRVARLCFRSQFLVGYGMSHEPLLDPVLNGPDPYWTRALDETVEENHAVLKGAGIEYVTIGMTCMIRQRISPDKFEEFGVKLNNRISEMDAHPGFQLVRSSQAEVLFKVV